MISEEDRKFGALLVEKGIVNSGQLQETLKVKKHSDEDLTSLIIQKGIASYQDVYETLAEYYNMPFIELEGYSIDPDVLEVVPKDMAIKYKIFPVFKIEDTLTVCMVNPGDVQVIDALRRETGYSIEPAVSIEKDIVFAIRKYFESSGELDTTLDEVIQDIESEKPKKEQEKTSAEKLKQLSAGTPVVKLVSLIISQAILDRASDIHIEPEEKSLQVRYRIDGILHETLSPPKHLQAAIISRIKILADMDIAENRIPQDGRFQMVYNGREVDMRVSSLPTVYGENIVMRILDKTAVMLKMEDLGLDELSFSQLQTVLSSSYGVILVSGPTGSGKTTTLYSALQSINQPDKKIVTVEDPVEYRLKGIRQCQVNAKAGLTFAAGLRSILRQDPDIIMVGEIRDTETARIAIESALTGHLVLSTIHTNDAPGAITRLTEMGIEPFLCASATIGVMAQRLVRRVCGECKKPFTPNEATLADLRLLESSDDPVFYMGEGCETCRNTGYKGRVGIYEVMIVNEEIRELILQHAPSTKIKQAAFKNGMRSLRQDALVRAKQGLTSIEEVFRVTNAD